MLDSKEKNKLLESANNLSSLRFDDAKKKFIIKNGHILSKLPLNELYEYMKALKVSFKVMHNSLVKYKKEVSKDESDKKDLVYNEKYDLPLIKELMDDFIRNSNSKKELLEKYGISDGTFTTYRKRIEEYYPNKSVQVNYALDEKNFNKWQTNYNMQKNTWKNKYFKYLIGGIKTTKEEKEKCLKTIKDAINKNKTGELTELNKTIILKAYPESIDLLNDYYKSLIYAHNKVDKEEDNEEGINWKDILIDDRNAMLMVYAPHLSTLSLEEIGKYNKDFKMSMHDMTELIKNYKKLFIDNTNNLNKYDLIILKEIVHDILEKEYKKVDLDKKYNLSSVTFENYIEQLKSIDIDTYNKVKDKLADNSRKHFYQMKELMKTLYDYIVNGIDIGTRNAHFSMLDYYSLTSLNTKVIEDFLNSKNNLNDPTIRPYRGRIIGFIRRSRNVGAFESAKTFANKKLNITFNGNKTEFDYDNSKKIIDFLRENNIPTNYTIIYTAARRYARGEDILPLKEITIDNKKEQEEDNRVLGLKK